MGEREEWTEEDRETRSSIEFDSLELTYVELERSGGAISALSSATIRDMTDITVCKESSSPCLTQKVSVDMFLNLLKATLV